MERPKIENYMNKDPEVIEVLGDKLPDFFEFSKANKEYINYLEEKVKRLENELDNSITNN